MTKEDILYRFKDINLYYNDCTAYDNLSRMLDDLISSSMAAGAALVTTGISETKGKWIPVSERLPEENKTVIASTKYGVYPEAKYTKEYGWEWAYEAGTDYWRELEDVEAWMPVPERYKPKED